MAVKRRQFTLEFKLEAVRLTKDSAKPLAQVARELGIRPDMLRTWKRQAESRAGVTPGDVFPGNGQLTSQDEEVRRLRRELAQTKQEHALLKKAAAYFAKESQCATPASRRTGTRSRCRSCAPCLGCRAPAALRRSSAARNSTSTPISDCE